MKTATEIDRAKRDLAWILSASPMLKRGSFSCEIWWGPEQWNQMAERLYRNLHLIPDGTLLEAREERRGGRYFERLLLAAMAVAPEFEILASDHQVHADGRTLGAFDLLLRDHEQEKDWHIELACKQYLLRGPAAVASSWVGPNARDRLDRKALHMRDQQLKLGETSAGGAALFRLQMPSPQPAGLMIGRLFWPWAEFNSGNRLIGPDESPESIQKGWWLSGEQWQTLADQPCDWRQLTSLDALTPLNPTDCERLPCPDWRSLADPTRRPVLLAAIENGQERDRGWLLPPQD